jgi:hypothetical protein
VEQGFSGSIQEESVQVFLVVADQFKNSFHPSGQVSAWKAQNLILLLDTMVPLALAH